jgi:hypothetical protein
MAIDPSAGSEAWKVCQEEVESIKSIHPIGMHTSAHPTLQQ